MRRHPFAILLPLVLASVVAAIILVNFAPSGNPLLVVCTPQDQVEYERCLAELPAHQAASDDSVRRSAAITGPVLALAGGSIVALATHLLIQTTLSRRADDIPAP